MTAVAGLTIHSFVLLGHLDEIEPPPPPLPPSTHTHYTIRFPFVPLCRVDCPHSSIKALAACDTVVLQLPVVKGTCYRTRFLKIGQFLKIVGSGENTVKETKEAAAPSCGVSEPTTAGTSSLLRDLPANATTTVLLHHVKQVIQQKYMQPERLGSHDPNITSIRNFLRLLRSTGSTVHYTESSASALDLSRSSPTCSHGAPTTPHTPVLVEQGTQTLSETWRSLDLESLQKDRAEMIDAIDVCLQEIPETTKKERRPVWNAEDSPSGSPQPMALADHSFTLIDWRNLLLDVVEVLIAMDTTLYFDFFNRGVSQMLASRAPDSTGAAASDTTSRTKRRKAEVSKDRAGNSTRRDVSLDLHKTIEDLLSTAFSIATWVMLRSVLLHQIEALQQGSPPSPREPSATLSGEHVQPLIEWSEVVAELRKIFCGEHGYLAECILCAAFLRDDGRELMYCFLQEPKSKDVLQSALSFTYKKPVVDEGNSFSPRAPDAAGSGASPTPAAGLPRPIAAGPSPSSGASAAKITSPSKGLKAPPLSSALVSSPPSFSESLVGTSMDDLNEEVEAKYQRYISNSWSQYLEDMLLLPPHPVSPNEFLSSDDPAHNPSIQRKSNSRTFCQLATAYFFCSDEWSPEERDKRFQLLEETDARKYAAERTERKGAPPPTSASSSLPDALANSGCTHTHVVAAAGPASTSPLQALPSLLDRPTAECSVLQEFETRILNMSWTAALHKRVEHCVAARPPMLDEAKANVEKERSAAMVFNDFRAKQRALSSAVHTFLAAGLSQEALSFSRRHFTNEKREWASRKQTIFSAVRYLQSMVQLVQAQAAFQAHGNVIETVQIVFPQADLCDKMLSVLAPTPRGAFILRFSDTRAKVLRSRVYLLQEGWRSHAFRKDKKDARYFAEYLQTLRQIRTSYRESEVYDARMERGHQLMQRKQFAEAATHFFDAVRLAKRAEVVNTRALPPRAAPEADAPVAPLTNTSFHRSIHLKVAGSGSLTTAEEHISRNRNINKELDRMWRLAESERLLAFAYVSQAENEVNVPQRRIELNNAVSYAYAAQATLQKWQVKGGTPKRMLTAVPCSLIVICKALMLLNQPKKAMLLLEPLIEEKQSSAAIRPPMWGEILQPTPEPLTAEDIVLRMDVNSVTIDVYQLYTQCIVQFDDQKALRAVDQVRSLLIEGDRWIRTVGKKIQHSDPPCPVEDPTGSPSTSVVACDEVVEVEEDENDADEAEAAEDTDSNGNDHDTICVLLESSSERLRALRALRRGSWDICRALRDIEIATGDAYCKLKQWDDALRTYEALLHILRDKTSSSNAPASEDLKLRASHYRPSAGPSSNNLGSAMPIDEAEATSPSGLSPPWRALLYGDDSMVDSAALDDQMRNITQDEADDGLGKMAPGEDLAVVMAEEERVDHHAATNLIYSKLAAVYEAVGDLQTSIRYHKLVLAYSNEIHDDFLHYRSLLHLGQETWEKVSALAREYEDQEVGRETMRNLINAKQTAGKYFEVVQSAEELNTLAQTAEGAGAAADRRFALETLANAHLQLGQFDECLTALDERETVQEKSGEWNGKLHEMRAQARIGKGEYTMAIKVLCAWAHKARQLKHFEEIGKANRALADAYAAESEIRSEIRAQRCHIDSIGAFGQLSVLCNEHCASVLASARWLVHYFYLSSELVKIDPTPKKNESESKSAASGPGSSSHAAPIPMLENRSGNLAVLMSEEERRREGLPSLLKGSIDCDEGIFAKGASLLSRDKGSILEDLEDVDTALSDGGITSGKTSTKSSKEGSGRHVISASSSVGSLANVSLCNRPAAAARGTDVLEMQRTEESRKGDAAKVAPGTKEDDQPKPSEAARAMVPTRHCQSAVETIEWCTQLLVQRRRHGVVPSPYSPAEAVDLALMTHPNCTFIFFFAEFTTSSSGSYDIIIRPCRSSYFITKSAQLTSLQPYKEALAVLPDLTADSASSSAFSTELQQQLSYLYDELWKPVASGLRSAKSRLNEADCVFIVPDASLYNVPFGALMPSRGGINRSSRKYENPQPLGVLATLVVAPSLTHLLHRGMLRDGVQSQCLKAPQFSRHAVLADVYAGRPAKPESEEVISVAKRTLFGRKTAAVADTGVTVIPDDEPLKALSCWQVHGTTTKRGLTEIMRDKSTKAVILGCPATASALKMSDGLLTCDDIISHTSSHSLSRKAPQYNCRHMELIVMQNNQNHHCTEEQPGLPIRLCYHAGCPRVLRVEDVRGQSLSETHRRIVARYMENLEKVLRHGQDFPFALALRMTLKSAWDEGLPCDVWSAFTLFPYCGFVAVPFIVYHLPFYLLSSMDGKGRTRDGECRIISHIWQDKIVQQKKNGDSLPLFLIIFHKRYLVASLDFELESEPRPLEVKFESFVELTLHEARLAAGGLLQCDPVARVDLVTIRRTITGNQAGVSFSTRHVGQTKKQIFTSAPLFKDTISFSVKDSSCFTTDSSQQSLVSGSHVGAQDSVVITIQDGTSGRFLGQAYCPFSPHSPTTEHFRPVRPPILEDTAFLQNRGLDDFGFASISWKVTMIPVGGAADTEDPLSDAAAKPSADGAPPPATQPSPAPVAMPIGITVKAVWLLRGTSGSDRSTSYTTAVEFGDAKRFRLPDQRALFLTLHNASSLDACIFYCCVHNVAQPEKSRDIPVLIPLPRLSSAKGMNRDIHWAAPVRSGWGEDFGVIVVTVRLSQRPLDGNTPECPTNATCLKINDPLHQEEFSHVAMDYKRAPPKTPLGAYQPIMWESEEHVRHALDRHRKRETVLAAAPSEEHVRHLFDVLMGRATLDDSVAKVASNFFRCSSTDLAAAQLKELLVGFAFSARSLSVLEAARFLFIAFRSDVEDAVAVEEVHYMMRHSLLEKTLDMPDGEMRRWITDLIGTDAKVVQYRDFSTYLLQNYAFWYLLGTPLKVDQGTSSEPLPHLALMATQAPAGVLRPVACHVDAQLASTAVTAPTACVGPPDGAKSVQFQLDAAESSKPTWRTFVVRVSGDAHKAFSVTVHCNDKVRDAMKMVEESAGIKAECQQWKLNNDTLLEPGTVIGTTILGVEPLLKGSKSSGPASEVWIYEMEESVPLIFVYKDRNKRWQQRVPTKEKVLMIRASVQRQTLIPLSRCMMRHVRNGKSTVLQDRHTLAHYSPLPNDIIEAFGKYFLYPWKQCFYFLCFKRNAGQLHFSIFLTSLPLAHFTCTILIILLFFFFFYDCILFSNALDSKRISVSASAPYVPIPSLPFILLMIPSQLYEGHFADLFGSERFEGRRKPSHALLLAEALRKGGKWSLAVKVFQEIRLEEKKEAQPVVVCICATVLDALHKQRQHHPSYWRTALELADEGWSAVADCEDRVDISALKRQCEAHVLPAVPVDIRVPFRCRWRCVEGELQRRGLLEIPENSRADGDVSSSSLAGPSPPPKATASSSSSESPEDALQSILRQPKRRDAWRDALEIFTVQVKNPDLTCFRTTLQCLTRQGRHAEAEGLVRRFCLGEPPLIKPSRRLVECLSDSADRMHAVELSKLLLSHPLAAQLTPTAAIRVVGVLSRPVVVRREWGVVDAWWKTTASMEATGDGVGISGAGYSLRTHLKLSSFVGKCIVAGSSGKEWATALGVFSSAEKCQSRDLALLYKLRLLRMAGQWSAAVQLFSQRMRVTDPPSNLALLQESYAIFFTQDAEKWMPSHGAKQVAELEAWQRTTSPSSTNHHIIFQLGVVPPPPHFEFLIDFLSFFDSFKNKYISGMNNDSLGEKSECTQTGVQNSSSILTTSQDLDTKRVNFPEWMYDMHDQADAFMNMLDQNHLSWRDDFFFFHAMSVPKKSQIFMRLNLNIPYYFYNYMQLTILATVPMLLLYNIPFLLLLASNCLCIYAIVRDAFTNDAKRTGVLTVCGHKIRVSYCVHFFLFLWLIIILFFNGVRTFFYVMVLNGIVVIPHALVRNPTFFDDEEMEKLRPKLINYLLMLVFVTLLYLEGDISGPEDENLRRSEQERERIKSFL
eukprot:gene4457-3252_t